MMFKQKEDILTKIRTLSNSRAVHPPAQQWANGGITPIDPLSIPAIPATGWSPDVDQLSREPRRGPHFNELQRFLRQMQNHTQAWPFIVPVNKDEAPDYYNAIMSPMDPSTMEGRLMQGSYADPRDFIADPKVIFENCRQYNDVLTVYIRCAVKLERYMWSLIKEIPEWFYLVEEVEGASLAIVRCASEFRGNPHPT